MIYVVHDSLQIICLAHIKYYIINHLYPILYIFHTYHNVYETYETTSQYDPRGVKSTNYSRHEKYICSALKLYILAYLIFIGLWFC